MDAERNTPTFPPERCPYLKTHTISARVPKLTRPIHISTTSCHLTEEMKNRLETTEAAKPLLDALIVRPYNAPPRSVCGPDLEPPVEPACTQERLQGRCIQSFQELLSHFQQDTSLPQERHQTEI
jgi:hypothetical protein